MSSIGTRQALRSENDPSDFDGDDLKVMIVESMNLAKAGEVKIFKKEIVRRGEHNDAYEGMEM